uniref:Uncharacterized protein n=1 Tax=Trichobilharzia regenti TaxID=157069 RepID=A0AA85JXT5_TRIRE|nr:unnamed protein product [Trichobilharzia regenti]
MNAQNHSNKSLRQSRPTLKITSKKDSDEISLNEALKFHPRQILKLLEIGGTLENNVYPIKRNLPSNQRNEPNLRY